MTDLRAPARLFYTSETALPRTGKSLNTCWESSRLLTRKPINTVLMLNFLQVLWLIQIETPALVHLSQWHPPKGFCWRVPGLNTLCLTVLPKCHFSKCYFWHCHTSTACALTEILSVVYTLPRLRYSSKYLHNFHYIWCFKISINSGCIVCKHVYLV